MITNLHILATALTKLCEPEQLADIISCTLSAEADERLTDAEVYAADMLHEMLCDLSPLAMHIAQTRSREGYGGACNT